MQVSVNETDAVHIYSDATRIWLQLRRNVPTMQDISEPSFKTALTLSRTQAIAIATELLTASKPQAGPPAAANPPATKPPTNKPQAAKQLVKPPPVKPTAPISAKANAPKASVPANHSKPWTAEEDKRLIDAFDSQKSIPQIAKAHQRGVGGIQSRLTKLGKITADQHKIYPPHSK